MAKEFNTAVTCNPKRHYMVDVTAKMKVFERLIGQGKYFTITRARQFGKSSALNWIYRNMSDDYLVIPASFEQSSSSDWADDKSFCNFFCNKIISVSEENKVISFWEDVKQNPNINFDVLTAKIKEFCQSIGRKVVLTIDEVDRSSDNQLFLNFWAMLRNLYLDRERIGKDDYTFWSVVLAGVYDVKNLKLKLRPDEEHKYNSPWNVAADYDLDMTFNPQEISTMLVDYENDYHIGFDIKEISEEIYKYTSGYPVLVSAVCKKIDEFLDKDWSKDGIIKAVKCILQDGNFTLLDDMSKNLQHYSDLKRLLFEISINGAQYSYSLLDPVAKLASMFAYIKPKNDIAVIHNLIFDEALHLYFINEHMRNAQNDTISSSSYIRNGVLDMSLVIKRFMQLMRQEHRSGDETFIERQGRLLFLCFLKPIINGTGFYYIEPETRDNSRMDLVVTYNRKEYIVELKIWHGTEYELSGREQLSGYLATRNLDEGYLVTFSFLKNKIIQDKPEWIEYNGKKIYEAVI
ncbi:MAG: AAA-like domain-containing protein [Bacteroidales bacterium]|nr:AAA-like domain-containing protein [Bacteroidales bacterium]